MTRSTEKAPYILTECPHCKLSFKAGDHDYKGRPLCQGSIQPRKTWHLVADTTIILLIIGAIVAGLYFISKHGI